MTPIGQRIKEVIAEKKVTVTWVATQVPCERTNLYNVFKRRDISMRLLWKLSDILEHNFFQELTDQYESSKPKKKSKK